MDLNHHLWVLTNKATHNTGFVSGGLTCKLEALCFYQSLCLVESEVLRNRHLRKARNRYRQFNLDKT